MAAKRPLKIGLYIPNGDGIMGGGNRRWRDVLAIAQRAEEIGFDSIWVADHLLFRFDDGEPTAGRWECWSLLAALAAATSRVELGPLVSCMSFRNPALLAKIAATTDEISGGRLILGAGAGWHEPEYHAYGFPFDHRVSRFAEGIEIVAGLLRAGCVDVRGQYERASNCELRPRGPRPVGIPLMIGGKGERMLQLAARYADLWNTTWVSDPADFLPLNAAVDRACEAVGRDPSTLARSACVLIDHSDHIGRWTWEKPIPPPPREPAAIAEVLHGFAGVGVTQVMLWPDPSTLSGVEALAPVLELLDRG
ncbi:MAG TPA: LLM class flavin-dependent oxidoreductase [Thermomicrobiales bacterium]|nr:LLM class flavin-dependent oxidoreductase [Thermomicrobiales bacterium]